MAPLSRESFTRHRRALDDDRLLEFVAALWRARGATITCDGPRLHIHDHGETQTIYVLRRSWWQTWTWTTDELADYPPFGPAMSNLAFTQAWPDHEGETASVDGTDRCFEPSVKELPYTEMRPNHDGGTTTPTPTAEASSPAADVECDR